MGTTNFRLQIRILMERKKVSIAKLSRIVDLHPDTIYKYLREESEISAANLERLFNTLNAMEDPKL